MSSNLVISIPTISLSKWPNSNQTHQHFVIIHDPYLVCTFFGIVIFIIQFLLNFYCRMHFLKKINC